jgi:hypothetical protein
VAVKVPDYVMNPDDPAWELDLALYDYARLVEKIEIWDDMEIANLLGARDIIEWALGALSEKVDVSVKQKVARLDKALKGQAEYLVREVRIYEPLRRRFEEPRSHWWWYLDELLIKKPEEESISVSAP